MLNSCLRLFTASIFGLQLGCASYFMRKDCESTNWFQHGEKVALTGKRLDSDNFIHECQKVDANFSLSQADAGFKAGMARYCSDDNVFEVGKQGRLFTFEMCDGVSTKKLNAQYQKGLAVYCTPSNAYRVGSSGGNYQGVCSKDLEEAWQTEFRKGRKVYLSAKIEQMEHEVRRVETQIIIDQGDLTNLLRQQSNLRQTTVQKMETVYDPLTRTYQQRWTQVQDPSAQEKAQNMDYEINRLESRIQDERERVQQTSQKIEELRSEMLTL